MYHLSVYLAMQCDACHVVGLYMKVKKTGIGEWHFKQFFKREGTMEPLELEEDLSMPTLKTLLRSL